MPYYQIYYLVAHGSRYVVDLSKVILKWKIDASRGITSLPSTVSVFF